MENHEIKALLPQGWELDAERRVIFKKFDFKAYFKAMSFVQSVGWAAQKHGHHPDMSVTFQSVLIELTTHDEGNQISAKDIELARAINELWF
jgi:4a-hydroxytetrahydrobiopterin dehydratase